MNYTQDILSKFGMKDAKPIKTPMGTNGHLDLDTGGKSVDQKVYRSMIGFLLYLCASRPDIMLSVCMCARFQSDPKECHLVAVKRILRYLVSMPCFRILGTQTLTMSSARLIGRAHRGLASSWEDPWCLGLQRSKIRLLFPPPKPSTLPQVIVARNCFG